MDSDKRADHRRTESSSEERGKESVDLVLVVIVFFHGITSKAFWGPTHRRTSGAKPKDCPRSPASHPQPGVLAPSCCGISPVSEAASLVLTKPRRTRAHTHRASRCHISSSIRSPPRLPLGSARVCAWTTL
uniref:Uncharacterized protein n=1 Tax=Molossus molossus TaxID=27622 RepID=A0A7J8CYZ2_MOLMO|nr:hypothetical protein HJG59_009481 [Molossus molossus]